MTTVKNLDKLIQKLNTLGGDSDMVMEKALLRPTNRVKKYAKLLCPVGDSGNLRNRIYSKVEKGPDGSLQGVVFTNVEYAAYVEFGTGPKGEAKKPEWAKKLGINYKHDRWFIPADKIKAETAEMYHFKKINVKGKVFYICYGQAAQPFLYPAYKSTEPKIAQDIRDVFNEYIRRLERK